jgi:methylase of polypeptide subunit release factors
LAYENKKALLSGDHAADSIAVFKKHSFADLVDLNLQEAVDESYRGFDIIVCNPPYLSSIAAAGRVTQESSVALVAGDTGAEAYEMICSSISQSIANPATVFTAEVKMNYYCRT